MLRHCSTTTATGPMLRCRQVVAMMQRQEERHRDKKSTLQRYEFHFTSIQRTSSVTYFAVRKTTQHKLPQLKLGPTIYAIGLPVLGLAVIEAFVAIMRICRIKFETQALNGLFLDFRSQFSLDRNSLELFFHSKNFETFTIAINKHNSELCYAILCLP